MRIATILLLLVLSNPSGAVEITWTWTNAGTGTEVGTFRTWGDMVGDTAPAGSYTIRDFTYDESAHNAVIGSWWGNEYNTTDPAIGFEWDGTEPTQFWRNTGYYTGGFGMYTEENIQGRPNWIVFDVDYFAVQNYWYGQDFLIEYQTVRLQPSETPVQGSTLSAVKALY